jgi:hypothetical protein
MVAISRTLAERHAARSAERTRWSAGQYAVRLSNGTYVNTQPLTVIEDPRNTAAGLTTADLQARFEHNMRVRDLVREVNQLVARVRAAQQSMKGKPDSASQLDAIDSVAPHLITPTLRYSKPELQTHVSLSDDEFRGRETREGCNRALPGTA